MTRRITRITRTAEHVEIPDLTRCPQWHGQLTRREIEREFRQCLAFAFLAVVLMGAAQFLWS